VLSANIFILQNSYLFHQNIYPLV